jgi:hypothetical protein
MKASFAAAKAALTGCVQLIRPLPGAKILLQVDASSDHISTALQQPGIVRAASSKAAAVSEEDFSSGARTAAAASSMQELAAPGTISTAPATAGPK